MKTKSHNQIQNTEIKKQISKNIDYQIVNRYSLKVKLFVIGCTSNLPLKSGTE